MDETAQTGGNKKTVEAKVEEYDPWRLLSTEVPSRCCEQKKATIVMYDYTGTKRAECGGCGKEYLHDGGVYGV